MSDKTLPPWAKTNPPEQKGLFHPGFHGFAPRLLCPGGVTALSPHVWPPRSPLPVATLMTCSVTHTVSFSLPLLNLSHPASTPGHTENEQPSLVWFDRGKFYLTFEGK